MYEHYDDASIINIWSEHYPKIIWIYGSLLYCITNNVYIGTSFGLILSLATLILCYDMFRKSSYSKIVSLISATIVSFGIVTLGQLFTMYNDGILATCILTIVLIYRAIIKEHYNKDQFLPVALILGFYLGISNVICFIVVMFINNFIKL